MEYIKRPKFPVLCGEEAINALYNYVDELEEKESPELTEKHKAVLTKVAKALISSLEDEVQTKEKVGKFGFPIPLDRIKQAILKPLQESVHNTGEDHANEETFPHDPRRSSKLPITQQIQ
jgi:hypothetical protein